MSFSPESPEYLKATHLLFCCDSILGGPALDKHQMAVYFSAVGSSDGKAVVAALRHWLAHEHRFPVPADIRQIIKQAQQTEQTA